MQKEDLSMNNPPPVIPGKTIHHKTPFATPSEKPQLSKFILSQPPMNDTPHPTENKQPS